MPPDSGPATPQVAPEGERPRRVVLLALPAVFADAVAGALRASRLDPEVVPDVAQAPAVLAADRRQVVVAPGRLAGQLAAAPPDRGGGRLALVLLLDRTEVLDYAEGLRSGAVGLVAAEAELEEVVQVVQGAGRGQTVLPWSVARALCRSPRGPALELSAQERSWLRSLAAGATMARLARSAGRSEREMFRLLSALYARLGVTTRTEALLRAQQHGVLDD